MNFVGTQRVRVGRAIRRKRAIAGATAAVWSTLCAASFSQAASYTFDSSGANPTAPVDGTGPWDNTSSLWSTGGVDTTYTNGANTAIFGTGNGTPGVVTLQNQIVVNAITFNASAPGYVITGSSLTAPAGATMTLTANGNAEIDSPIAQSVTGSTTTFSSVVVAGTGVLTLGGSNTFTVPFISINLGATLNVIKPSTGGGLGASTGGVRVTGGTLRVSGGSGVTSTGIQFRDEGGILDMESSGTGAGSVTFNYRADLTDNTGATSRLFTLNSGSTFPALFQSTTGAGLSNTTSTPSGKPAVTVVTSLLKTGVGAFYLSGTGNSAYTGSTTVTNGTLGLAAATTQIPANQTVTLGSGSNTAALDLGAPFGSTSYPLTVAGLNSSGTAATDFVTNNDPTAAATNHSSTLTINPSGGAVPADSTFGGVIKNGNTSKVALTKAGTNTFTLAGTNTYSGATSISGGTLAISGSIASGTVNLTGATALANLTLLNVAASALASNATINVTTGSFAPTIYLDYTGNQNVFALIINGTSEPAGTYSAALQPPDDTTLFASDSGFAGTLTVVGAPEPSILGAFSVAGMTLTRRRRRTVL